MATTTRFIYAGDTHPGQARENNEDRWHADPDRGIFMVVDGVGGQAAGEEAADIAIVVLRARLERQTGRVVDRIREAIALANNEIYHQAQQTEDSRGMACVLTVAVVDSGRLCVGHVGDTRLYKVHRGQIRKLTRDHSPVGEREDAGRLTELEAMRHPRRHEVYRDVGSEPHEPDDEDFIDTIEATFEPDSALLVCSDGLTDMVPSAVVLRIMEQHAGDPWATVRALIDEANAAGGKDNITAVIVEGEAFAAATRGARTDGGGLGPSPAVARLGERDGPPPPVATKRQAVLWLVKLFGGRWAVFLYGLWLGVVLLMVWPAGTGPEPRAPGPPEAPARPKVLAVGPDGPSDFPTMAGALDQARAGDTVLVGPGVYHDQVQLKTGVALISRNPREAVIQPVTATGGPAVSATNVQNGRFVGFKILGHDQGPLSMGILLVDSDVEIEDVEVTGMSETGIDIGGGSRAVLRANFVHDNPGGGVKVRGEAAPRLAHNVVVRNGRQSKPARPGVEIMERAQPVLVGNVIAGNGGGGVTGLSGQRERDILENNFFVVGGKTDTKPRRRAANPDQPQ